ncbi:MAG: AAA family ATPase [Candidatus Lokiarchaeota archaeon]|nr:AAA family ATPase [Candidatus Lokiarchaeota archaeon]
MIGQKYSEMDDLIKWAVWGSSSTGKTHFALSATKLKPDKKVLVFNLEPKSNLYSVLKRFPEVEERTTVLPTDDDWDDITAKALELDPTEKKSALDAALAYYIVDKVIDIHFNHRDILKDTFFIMDTASQIYRKLMWEVMEARETDERLKRMAQLAYSEPKRIFQQLIRYTAMWPTDVIWLGRARQGGEEVLDPQTGKPRWKAVKGKEDPEWKSMLDFEATCIIYLTKREEHVMDEQRSYVLDEFGQPKKALARYGKITKHKSGRNDVPVIKDPTPSKVVAWLKGMI